jgi:hypothetical protein
MAKNKDKNKDKKVKKRGLPIYLWLPLFLLLAIFLKASFVLLLFAMLPTIVANYADNTDERMRVLTVGCCNMAGVLPYFVPCMMQGGDLEHLKFYMVDGKMWLVIYGIAACGYGLVRICPSLCHFFLKLSYAGKCFHIQQKQDALLREWGDDLAVIASTASNNKTARVGADI